MDWKKWIKNRYVIAVLVSVVYLLFLEEMTIVDLMSYKSKVNELEDKKVYYQAEIDQTRKSIKELTTDQSALEKFAREQHYMKRANEDVFVFIEKSAE